jgi:hypothetical protein
LVDATSGVGPVEIRIERCRGVIQRGREQASVPVERDRNGG